MAVTLASRISTLDIMSALKTTRKDKPFYGRVIEARRAFLGRKSAMDIENETQNVIYQKLLYRIEGGDKHPLTLNLRQFNALLKALEWTPEQFEEETGLTLPPTMRVAMPVEQVDRTFGRAATVEGPLARHLGIISAGAKGPSFADDTIKKVPVPLWIAEKYDVDDVFVLTVSGDSMACETVRDTIPSGCEVYMHSKLRPEEGEIIACWLLDEDIGVLKIYRPNNGYTVLESYNRQHAPIYIDKDTPARLQGVYLGKSEPGPRFR